MVLRGAACWSCVDCMFGVVIHAYSMFIMGVDRC